MKKTKRYDAVAEVRKVREQLSAYYRDKPVEVRLHDLALVRQRFEDYLRNYHLQNKR
jgi:hypothetical protein